MVTNKETKPFRGVKNIPELIAFIDKYLTSISEKIDGKDFKDNIFEIKKNSKGKPTKFFKNLPRFKSFESFCTYTDARIYLEKERIFNEKCLIHTKKRLSEILHLSRPTLNRFEKIGIIEKIDDSYNLFQIRSRLISNIMTDIEP